MNGTEFKDFRLPRYREIPDIGLLLEQTVRLVNGYLEPLGAPALTPSMVSNYVKTHIIDRAVKKQYSREQIAYLVFIAVAKMVIPLNDIQLVIERQRATYPADVAYNRFCDEFERALRRTSEAGAPCEAIEEQGGYAASGAAASGAAASGAAASGALAPEPVALDAEDYETLSNEEVLRDLLHDIAAAASMSIRLRMKLERLS